ncbi:seminal metalloprotease 1 [Drosophila innubila]|uniref:seminal metalloprotease 1 n=1 Tax=Drosophila innubila TaxID=198719 RepID=UPI00148BE61E|nr:seminal metalloprotease 1 [Drosophila innubila]
MQSLSSVILVVLSTQLLQSGAMPLRWSVDPEEIGGFAEGDMQLTEEQQLILEHGPKERNGLIDASKRWPNNLVIYQISEDFDAEHKQAILRGIKTLEDSSCLKFREATLEDAAFVRITANPGGCFTAVGYQGQPQEMNLEIYPIGEGCFRPGTILHEFMHALGFYHEQSSAIRDDYIDVVQENIVPGKEFNFKKYSSSVITDFDVGYDYNSCLHYRPGAFSVNGKDTIIPLDDTVVIGQRTGLSKKDIDKINIMYKCPHLV